MEGIYFFGEHVRWNLGWSNPNQAGVFIGMWIPWFWALGAWTAGFDELETRLSWQRLRRNVNATFVLVGELVLWFLLFKTYSRGALLAVGMAGLFSSGWRLNSAQRFRGLGLISMRLILTSVLLFTTGFFSRIAPQYVSQDASAGNRLTLWKGGLQMIAASPWHGWGAGQSGSSFAHWFQPLDATEKYGGMVNSYLHVAVEYGLPVLVAAMTAAVGIWMLSYVLFISIQSSRNLPQNKLITPHLREIQFLISGAGSSWLMFLIANIFSTLWIFKNLWYLPIFDGFVILIVSYTARNKCLRIVLRTFGVASAACGLFAISLYVVGKLIPNEVRIAYFPGGGIIVSGNKKCTGKILVLSDVSVLGEDWGKEIRRLAIANGFPGFEIIVPSAISSDLSNIPPQNIIACGSQFAAGMKALQRFPEAHLILVHPLGKPSVLDECAGRVSVMLPMLDTRNTGRIWRTIGKEKGWEILTSSGVGQDLRPLWPEVLILSLGAGETCTGN
jgi:hypothetical protein